MSIPTQVTSLTATSVLASASKTANVNGAAVDLRPYNGKAVVIVNSGDITAGADDSTYTIALLTGADTNISNASAATLNTSVICTNVGSVQTATVDTRVADRYLFAQANIAGASSPAFPVGVTIVATPQYGS